MFVDGGLLIIIYDMYVFLFLLIYAEVALALDNSNKLLAIGVFIRSCILQGANILLSDDGNVKIGKLAFFQSSEVL